MGCKNKALGCYLMSRFLREKGSIGAAYFCMQPYKRINQGKSRIKGQVEKDFRRRSKNPSRAQPKQSLALNHPLVEGMTFSMYWAYRKAEPIGPVWGIPTPAETAAGESEKEVQDLALYFFQEKERSAAIYLRAEILGKNLAYGLVG